MGVLNLFVYCHCRMHTGKKGRLP